MDITTSEIEDTKRSLETQTLLFYEQEKFRARRLVAEAISRSDYIGVISYVKEHDFTISENYLRAAADKDAQRSTFHSLNDAIWAYKRLGLEPEAQKIKKSYRYFRAKIEDFWNSCLANMSVNGC